MKLSEKASVLASQLFELAGKLHDVSGQFAHEVSADADSRDDFRRAVIDVQRAYDRLRQTDLVMDAHRDPGDQAYFSIEVATWGKVK